MSEQFSVELTAGYLDSEGGGHVSNVTFPKYLELARSAYLRETLGDRLRDREFVVANLDLDYLDELFPGETFTVKVHTVDIGTTSFTLEYRVATEETVVAEATTVQVVQTPGDRESTRVPDDWRERLLPEATA